MMTATNIGVYHVQLVREFIVNRLEKITDVESLVYLTAYERGKCIDFSHCAINDYLGRIPPSSVDPLPAKVDLVKEIRGGKYKKWWPEKGLYPTSELSIKYSILHKFGVKNWASSAHSTDISLTLAQFIHQVENMCCLIMANLCLNR